MKAKITVAITVSKRHIASNEVDFIKGNKNKEPVKLSRIEVDN